MGRKKTVEQRQMQALRNSHPRSKQFAKATKILEGMEDAEVRAVATSTVDSRMEQYIEDRLMARIAEVEAEMEQDTIKMEDEQHGA